MNVKKLFIWSTIIVGIIGLILIIMLVFSDKTSSCETGHNYDNSTGYCFYTNTTCPQDTLSVQVSQDTETGVIYNCLYKPQNIFDNKVFLLTIILIGVGWVIIFVIFLVDLVKKGNDNTDMSEFRKEDFVNADRVRTLWAITFSKEHGIAIHGEEKYDISKFNWYGKQNIFQKGQEWFVRFQCEVTDGRNPGLYTVIISMSRGEKWIQGGNQNWEECSIEDYKFSRTMPIHTPQNIRERMIQQLMESNPEKAMQIQQKMLEEGASAPMQEQVAPDVINPADMMGGYMPYRRPQTRRPWYYRR